MKRVYVMDCGDFVKIGVSGNPDKRQENIPYKVHQYYCTEPIPNYLEIEKFMHKFLWARRSETANGTEYFKIDFQLACFILKNVCDFTEDRKNIILSVIVIKADKESYGDAFYKGITQLMTLDNADLIFFIGVIEGMIAKKEYEAACIIKNAEER